MNEYPGGLSPLAQAIFSAMSKKETAPMPSTEHDTMDNPYAESDARRAAVAAKNDRIIDLLTENAALRARQVEPVGLLAVVAAAREFFDHYDLWDVAMMPSPELRMRDALASLPAQAVEPPELNNDLGEFLRLAAAQAVEPGPDHERAIFKAGYEQGQRDAVEPGPLDAIIAKWDGYNGDSLLGEISALSPDKQPKGAGHPYTCGICSWGRAPENHSPNAYADHMAWTHPDKHEDEYDALARQLHESIAEGQSVALTAKALRILASLPAQAVEPWTRFTDERNEDAEALMAEIDADA